MRVSLGFSLIIVGTVVAGCEDVGDLGATKAQIAPDPSIEQAQPSAVACYEAARDRTPLNQQQATALCQGTASVGPVECFLASQKRTPLSDWPAIKLCVCARGTDPVACYERADEDTDLTRHQIVARCRSRCVD